MRVIVGKRPPVPPRRCATRLTLGGPGASAFWGPGEAVVAWISSLLRGPRGGSLCSLSVFVTCAGLMLCSPPRARAVPPKALANGKTGPALMQFHLDEIEARKWGMDMPHPDLKFDGAIYGEAGAKRNALVILLDFSDKQGSVPPGNIENLLFSEGTYSTGSMRDYYLENSYGLLDVQGQVVGWFRSEREYSYYVDGRRGLNFGNGDRNARGMAEEALRLADPVVDFSQFDNDGPDGIPSSGDDDGYIDALLIVHAGPGSEETNDADDILSHQSYFRNDIVYDGVRAILYTTEPENGKVGVFCHEFGHAIGLPDLYDISQSPGASVGLGYWSLMGTGVWLNDGRTPAHLDAWSKVTLGFIDPVVPASNEPHVVLPPVEVEPVVYKIWTNGRPGQEYFLAEFREQLGFDSELPESGLLVYHVDESVRLQDDPSRYKVALEQADGLMQLENQFGNNGDTGDPFPGATNNRFFTPFSSPNSLDYEGRDTQISLSDISIEAPAGGAGPLLGFFIEVEREPAFVLESVSLDDPEGDGDGIVGFGEPGLIKAVVKNVGLGTSNVKVDFESLSSALELEGEGVAIGDVGADSSFAVSFGFTWVGVPHLEQLTIGLPFNLHLTDGGITSWDLPFAVGAGFGTGMFSDFEAPYPTWTHEPVTEGREDAWALTTARARSGVSSWAFSGDESYPNRADGALVSPVVLLAPNSQLVFFYWVEAESLGSSVAWDGGRIEISNNGGPWRALEPDDGYTFTVTEFGDTPLAGAGVISGERDWTQAAVDLSEYSGMAMFRFRFVSDDTVGLEGLYIDDFAVVSRNYTVSFDGLRDSQSGVEIELGVTEIGGSFDGEGFNIYRKREGPSARSEGGRVPPGYEKLNTSPLLPDEAGVVSYLDETAQRGRTYLYLVEDLGPEGPGAAVFLGPERIYLCLGGARPFLSVLYPSPFMPGGGRLVTLPLGVPDADCTEQESEATVHIFDAAGRLVRGLGRVLLGAGMDEIVWDGRNDDGDLVASGIYLWRVRVSGETLAAKMIVVR